MEKKMTAVDYPRVSVIILTYNGADYIANLINSLLDQSYPEDRIEIIAIDNASTDNTPSLIKNKFPMVKLITLEKNIGFAKGNNLAISHADADYLAFLNQDTICHHNWLRGLVEKILADKNTAACASNVIPADPDDLMQIDRHAPKNFIHVCDLSPFGYGRYKQVSNIRFLSAGLMTGCAFLIKRKLIEDMGYLFDPQLTMYAEDTDLSLRLRNLGYDFFIIRDSIVFHLHGAPDQAVTGKRLSIAAQAIMNRVYAFYKNMDGIEFILFYPILLFGGIFKILEFKLSLFKKIVFFPVFGFFSIGCMLAAIFYLPNFSTRRKRIISMRRKTGFPILKMLFD